MTTHANTVSGLRVTGGFRRRALLGPWIRLIVRRLMLAVLLLLFVSALTFVLVSAEPGNVTQTILGVNGSDKTYRGLEKQLGLTQPVYDQYWHWLTRAIHGDLGTSWVTNQNVSAVIADRFPITMSLILGSLVLVAIVGVGLGVLGAVRRGAIGRGVDLGSVLGFALPSYWVAGILVSIFAVSLGWFASTGYAPFTLSPVSWLRSIVLPVVALSLAGVAVVARQTREAMLDVLATEHIRAAWAHGTPVHQVYLRLAFKNAAMVVVTVLGLQMISLLVGTVFVEQVFALPGLGSALVQAATNADIPVVEGVTVFFTLLIVAINLIVDLVYAVLDPRVRTF